MKLERRGVGADIPTASMADIAFLLITFFMVTAVFSMNRGIDFGLTPEGEQPPQDAQSEEAVHIRITDDGQICLDGKAADARGILPYLKPKRAPYERFIDVYDELRQADLPADQGGLGLKKLNVSIPSLQEINRLKQIFGEDIFGAEGTGCS
jgi:hypothetical protein